MGCIILLLYCVCMYFFTAFNNILLYYIFLQYFWVAFNGLIFYFIYLFYFLPFWQEIKKKKNQSEVSGPTQEYRIIIIIIMYPCLFGVVCKDILHWLFILSLSFYLYLPPFLFLAEYGNIAREKKKKFPCFILSYYIFSLVRYSFNSLTKRQWIIFFFFLYIQKSEKKISI